MQKILFTLLLISFYQVSARKSLVAKHKVPSFFRTAGDLLNFCMFEFRTCIYEQECLEKLDDCGLFRLRDKFRGYEQSELLSCLKNGENEKILGLIQCVEEIQKNSIDERPPPYYQGYPLKSKSSESSSDKNSKSNRQPFYDEPVPKSDFKQPTSPDSQFVNANTVTRERFQKIVEKKKK